MTQPVQPDKTHASVIELQARLDGIQARKTAINFTWLGFVLGLLAGASALLLVLVLVR